MYREQVIQLEDELSRIREEGDVTREIFKVCHEEDQQLNLSLNDRSSNTTICKLRPLSRNELLLNKPVVIASSIETTPLFLNMTTFLVQ